MTHAFNERIAALGLEHWTAVRVRREHVTTGLAASTTRSEKFASI